MKAVEVVHPPVAQGEPGCLYTQHSALPLHVLISEVPLLQGWSFHEGSFYLGLLRYARRIGKLASCKLLLTGYEKNHPVRQLLVLCHGLVGYHQPSLDGSFSS
jgi:hypothetical protein